MDTSAVPRSTAPASAAAARPWWQVGLVAALLAALANLLVLFLAEGVFGQRLQVPDQQRGGLMDLGPVPIVLFTVVPALVATLLAAFLARRVRSPRRVFLAVSLAVSLAVLGLSFLTPLVVEIAAGTRLTLEIMHIVAGAAIIWPLFNRLPPDRR